jgi:cytochrome c biogenesis protein
MRTAIILLFALAIAAVPGGLVPQRPTSPFQVGLWKQDNPRFADLFEVLGIFDVYHSPWFAAVYLLLFVSLVGCIVPRVSVYVRALQSPAADPPRPVPRLSGAVAATAEGTAAEVLAAAEKRLRRQGFRTGHIAGSSTVAGEKGYLREAGNLSFHIALLGMLVTIAVGNLFGYRGHVIVVEGQGFSNTLTQYDDLSAGPFFNARDLDPFTLRLDVFRVSFETGPVQRGAARQFDAEVDVTTAEGTERRYLGVNSPVFVGGSEIHLVGHGYAPIVTVRDGANQVAFSGPVVFQPVDGNMRSAGVVNARDARPERLGFEGYFVPSAVSDERGIRSVFPDALNPQLVLNVWAGPPVPETGRPMNVYVLDKSGMAQVKDATTGDLARMRLNPGDTYVLPDGKGSVTFGGWQRWTKLQISHTPGMGTLLGWLAVAVIGMTVSLLVRPRRVWLHAEDAGAGTVRVHAAGIDRVDGRSGVADDRDRMLVAVGAIPDVAPDDTDTDAGDQPYDDPGEKP